jgi:hypothetical protein
MAGAMGWRELAIRKVGKTAPRIPPGGWKNRTKDPPRSAARRGAARGGARVIEAGSGDEIVWARGARRGDFGCWADLGVGSRVGDASSSGSGRVKPLWGCGRRG